MSPSSRFTRPMLRRLTLGILLEFVPIFIFLAAFGRFHIYIATTLLMIGTIVSTILTYRFQRRLPYVALYVTFITIVFGYLTLFYREPRFIQMRDTLYDLTCAITLLFGLVINVPFLKIAFHRVIPMSLRAWHRLTYAWIGYFLAIAAMNELVRRYYSLEDWFQFKAFVVVFTVIFGIAALYFFYEREESKEKSRS